MNKRIEYNPNLFMGGFTEGIYSSEYDYEDINRDNIGEYKKYGENANDIFDNTEFQLKEGVRI